MTTQGIVGYIYFFKNKYKAFETFKFFKALEENTLGNNIKELRLDDGVEYIKREF